MKKYKIGLASAVALTAALTLASCSSGDPLAGETDTAGSAGSTVVIGSADFTENQLVATIYSQALSAAGVDVREQFNIGSREVYIAALQDSSIDLVPEYNGALLKYLDQKSTASTSEQVDGELEGNLPEGISMLDASPAENKDVLAVTRATAEQYNLRTISDLEAVAGQLKLGGPPEWVNRVNGVVGLRDVYGLEFQDFVTLDAGGTLTMTALTSGQIQVADLFSTDPGLVDNDLVALEDDKSLFASENIVPIIKTAKSSDVIADTLNAVSAKLSTDDLITMNADAATGTALTDIAQKWLADNGVS